MSVNSLKIITFVGLGCCFVLFSVGCMNNMWPVAALGLLMGVVGIVASALLFQKWLGCSQNGIYMGNLSADKILTEFKKIRDEIDEVSWQDRLIKSCYELAVDLELYQEDSDAMIKALNALETSLTKIIEGM